VFLALAALTSSLFTPHDGFIPIESDNLYRTRTNKDGTLIIAAVTGVCIKDGKCDIHPTRNNTFNAGPRSCYDSDIDTSPCTYGSECRGVVRTIDDEVDTDSDEEYTVCGRKLDANDLNILSTDSYGYSRNTLSHYCPDHRALRDIARLCSLTVNTRQHRKWLTV